MYRAHEDLPEDLRKAIAGRTVRQDCVFNAAGEPMIRPGGVQVEHVVESPGIETPIIQVRRHTWELAGRPPQSLRSFALERQAGLRAVAGGWNDQK